MYRLDLSDSLLYLPSPVYKIKDNRTSFSYLMHDEIDSLINWELLQEIPFFAFDPDRGYDGLIPVYEVIENGKTRLQVNTPDHTVKALFYGIPEFSAQQIIHSQQYLLSPLVVPLYEFKDQDGTYSYSVKSEIIGFKRSEKPVCLVWKNPSSVFSMDFKAKPVLFKR